MTPPSDLARLLGRRVAALRQRAGLSQRELAQQLGWARDTLAHYELGRREMGLNRLAALAAALRVSPATLLARDDQAQVLLALDADPQIIPQVVFFLTALAQGGDPAP